MVWTGKGYYIDDIKESVECIKRYLDESVLEFEIERGLKQRPTMPEMEQPPAQNIVELKRLMDEISPIMDYINSKSEPVPKDWPRDSKAWDLSKDKQSPDQT
jgi:hypothetical protein